MMERSFNSVVLIFLFSLCFFLPAIGQSTTEYDIVLIGGRVMDPETKLDTIKNVGIINNRIAQISSEELSGKEIRKPPHYRHQSDLL